MPKKPKNRLVKAYLDEDFLLSSKARLVRIMAEYLEPESRFENLRISDTIVMYGSARIPSREDAENHLAEVREAGGDTTEAEEWLAMSRYYEDARELANRLTTWSKGLDDSRRRFLVCTGGGPGIMEAANRGASEAKGLNMGLNISLPFEQHENPYVTRQLLFEFHYFFMRKFWFVYLAKAIICFPGGMGTLDEFFELLTLAQTHKLKKRIPIVLFGASFWDQVLNFDVLVRHRMIDATDLDLFLKTDSVDEAFEHVTRQLEAHAMQRPGWSL
ncbi:MAG: LOG family protein [Rhodospirillales bacterium]|nr:LOG family protein [Rhodospirillales bacterium]